MRLSGFVIAVLSFELACARGNGRASAKRMRDQYIFVVLGMLARRCFVMCVFIQSECVLVFGIVLFC